jgi:hypothetical protein
MLQAFAALDVDLNKPGRGSPMAMKSSSVITGTQPIKPCALAIALTVPFVHVAAALTTLFGWRSWKY